MLSAYVICYVNGLPKTHLSACCLSRSSRETGMAPMVNPSPRDNEKLPLVIYPIMESGEGSKSES